MALKLGSIVGVSNGYLMISSDPLNGSDSETFYPDIDSAIAALKDVVTVAEGVIANAKKQALEPSALVLPKRGR